MGIAEWGSCSVAQGLSRIIDYRGKTPPKSSSGITLISAANVKGGRVVFANPEYIGEADYARWTTRGLTLPGDVLITTEAPAGEVAAYPKSGLYQISRRVMALRCNENILHHRYLLYALLSPPVRSRLLALNRGTTVPRVLKTDITGLTIPLPPLAEQRRIAGILGALDDKIELNRKMNETLEQMAQAIFKSWFIDFDGHTEFEDSELGRIPKGWRVVGLGDTGKWVSGGTPSKDEASYWNGDIPWFSAKSMGQLWLSDSEQRLTKSGAERGSRLVPRRTVLFIVRGMSLANEWRIGLTTREAALNQDLKGIVDDGRALPELLLAWLLHMREEIRGKADEAGHGTKRLPTEILHSFSLVMPERQRQEELAKPITSLLAKIEVNLSESQTLAALRDTLLPKLISGELRIPEAEDLVSTPTQLPLPNTP